MFYLSDLAHGHYIFNRYYPSWVGDTVRVSSGGYGSPWTFTLVKNVGIVSLYSFARVGNPNSVETNYHLVH